MSRQPTLFEMTPREEAQVFSAHQGEADHSYRTPAGRRKDHLDYVHEVGHWLNRNVPQYFDAGFFQVLWRVPGTLAGYKERETWCNGLSFWGLAIMLPANPSKGGLGLTGEGSQYMRPDQVIAKRNRQNLQYELISDELRARWIEALAVRESHPGFKWTGTYKPLAVPDLPEIRL